MTPEGAGRDARGGGTWGQRGRDVTPEGAGRGDRGGRCVGAREGDTLRLGCCAPRPAPAPLHSSRPLSITRATPPMTPTLTLTLTLTLS
eukprot:6882105-Prymnesium_polylepis.1